ncbi:glycosyltransferase [Asanoa siamensis]|uniref:Glycosyl transferase n=1 Tax=Asanoa siamensis TaxID=926357 RepID=A0ABQ4D1T5_9ACTN|nr:glycosyltransferase [Asanoa siamensis]GIF77501.1 glycosyl transferase [Asanoa siamensis]
MRILFTGVPVLGHLLPLLPLARAVGKRGHTVAFMVPGPVAPLLAPEGFEIITTGEDVPAMTGELIRRTGVDPMAGPIPPEVEAEFMAGVRVDASTEELLGLARDWRPDLIVADPYDLVGPLVAVTLDVPVAIVTLGPELKHFESLATPRVGERYAARGLTRRPARFVLDICPPGLQRDGWVAPAGWLPMRPEAHRGPAGVPAAPVQPLPAQPRILLTAGTIFGNPEVLGPVVKGLAATGAGLRVTLGLTMSPDQFDVDREAVRFEPFAPINELLPDIDVVVGHGGAGTNLAALAAGIPLVLTPQGADQFFQTERAVATGAAARILPDEFSVDAVVTAVGRVLAEPSYRENARRIADEIAAMPTPDEVATTIEVKLA